MFENFIRTNLRKLLTKEKQIALEGKIPLLENRFQDIDKLGLYLHIPFCEQICPYCPYNKEIYRDDLAEMYAVAVKKEINFYSDLVGNRPVTSLYIGGGTPTTMLYSGIEDILNHIFAKFNMQCDIHIESHPNHLSLDNLNTILSMGIKHLSIGVEALQDRHLRVLKRPYTAEKVKTAVRRAVNMNFECVNVDFIFALPDQTYEELEQTGRTLTDINVDQIAAYPFFGFPYTKMREDFSKSNYRLSIILKRRKMLKILENIFYEAGFERTSVWAFTKQGIPKYCSVAVPLYVGLGASGSSYLRDIFYINTFSVMEYIKALENGNMPIALSLDLTENMQMAGWFYWRIYETEFKKSNFMKRFGKEFNMVYGKYTKLFSLLGLLKDDGDQIILSDRGAYWLHVFEDLFSLNYVGKLWGTAKQEPWPKQIVL